MSQEGAGRIAKVARRIRRHAHAPLKLVLPTAAALGAGAAVAIGSIPGTDGTITGCYNTIPIDGTNTAAGTTNTATPYGELRVIDPTDSTETVTAPGGSTTSTATDVYECNSASETTITWDQTGPTGPQGSPGTNGTDGVNGTNGANGKDGAITGDTSFTVASSGASKLYAKVSGVTGPASFKVLKSETQLSKGPTETLKGEIALKSFAVGSETPTDLDSGGGGGEAKNVQTFSFVKAVDKTSPILFKDESNGTTIRSAEVEVLHANRGAGAGKAADYRFSDLVIKAIETTGGTERITGVFRALESTVGTGKDTVTENWNRVKNVNLQVTTVPSG